MFVGEIKIIENILQSFIYETVDYCDSLLSVDVVFAKFNLLN